MRPAAGQIELDASLEVRVEPRPAEPRRVAEIFERFAEEHDLPPQVLMRMELALDEALTNVVSYAFPEESGDAVITVGMDIRERRVRICIEDNGPPFDPLTEAPEPDVEAPAEEREIGGLGVHLAKTFVETLRYERVDGRNRLTLEQSLEDQPENSPS